MSKIFNSLALLSKSDWRQQLFLQLVDPAIFLTIVLKRAQIYTKLQRKFFGPPIKGLAVLSYKVIKKYINSTFL